MNIKKELGEKIKTLRKKKSLTQERLAEMVNISTRNLSGIEAGANFVKAETLEKILTALNCTTEELFSNNHIKDNDELLADIQNSLEMVKNDKAKLRAIYRIINCIIDL